MKITIVASLVPLDEKNGASVPVHRGEVVDVPKAVADRLVRIGAAAKGVVNLAGPPLAQAVPPEEPATEVVVSVNGSPGDLPVGPDIVVGDPTGDPVGDPDDPDADDVADLERPAQAAPLDTWVAYAVAQGVPESEASEMTKKDLISRFS